MDYTDCSNTDVVALAAAEAMRIATQSEVATDNFVPFIAARLKSLKGFRNEFAQIATNESFMLLFLYEYMHETVVVTHQAATERTLGSMVEKERHRVTMEKLLKLWRGELKVKSMAGTLSNYKVISNLKYSVDKPDGFWGNDYLDGYHCEGEWPRNSEGAHSRGTSDVLRIRLALCEDCSCCKLHRAHINWKGE